VEIHRILCPSDLSDASAHAVEQAAVIAAYYKARICALHALSPLTSSIETTAIDECRRRMRAFFDPATKAGIAVDIEVELGVPITRILEWSASLPADLIVMGTHGTGGFEHFILGSVTEKVLRKAACPVLTVPPRAHATSRLPFKRLLCAIDFSDVSLSAAQWALSLAHESSAGLTLLHVLEWPWPEPPAPTMAELPTEQAEALMAFRRYSEESARHRLDSLLQDASQTTQVSSRIGSGKAWAEILRVAREEQSDLIVIGVRGRNPLDVTLFGSTTNHVVRRATCPVLTLH
jgi:nucleotide-binding universal stress UspA family protein